MDLLGVARLWNLGAGTGAGLMTWERSNAIGPTEIANGLWRKVSSPERGSWMSPGGIGWLPISLSIGGVQRVRVL